MPIIAVVVGILVGGFLNWNSNHQHRLAADALNKCLATTAPGTMARTLCVSDDQFLSEKEKQEKISLGGTAGVVNAVESKEYKDLKARMP